jgi:hypothetical protein
VGERLSYPIDYIYTDLQFSEIIEDEWSGSGKEGEEDERI